MLQSTKILAALTDEMLLEEMKGNNTAAFETLYQRHIDLMYRVAYKRLQSKPAADDVIQEVFLRFYERCHQMDPLQSVKGYLLTSLRNRIINEFRNRLLHEQHHANIAATQPTNHTFHPTIDGKALEQRFRNILEEIPDKCREVFELSRFEAMPNKFIAERLGISVSTVEKHIGKALAILRKELNSHELGLISGLLWCLLEQ